LAVNLHSFEIIEGINAPTDALEVMRWAQANTHLLQWIWNELNG
jgi:hypothetical protein